MDELYGYPLATIIWDRNHSAQSGIFKVYHEYIIAYAKNINMISTPKSSTNEKFEAGALKKVDNRHPMNKFTFPKGTRFDAPDGTELSGEWGSAEKVKVVSGRMISNRGKLKEDVTLAAGFTQINQMKDYFDGKDVVDSRGQKVVEFYLNSSGKVKVVKERGVETPSTVQRFGTQSSASDSLAKLFEAEVSYFSSPKPVKMLKQLVSWFSKKDSIILDFFAGSATTADAVMQLNAEDGGKRKFIMVQLPEKTYDVNSDGTEVPTKGGKTAYDAGYRFIDEISRERIRRASEKIKEDAGLTLPENFDGSFKHYRVVNPTKQALEDIEDFDPNNTSLFTDMVESFSSKELGVAGDATGEETILTTWLAKDGYSFEADIKKIDFDGYEASLVEDNRLYIIKGGWTSQNTKALLNKIGTHQLTVQTIILFGYSFNIADLQELEIGLKQLDGGINLLKRY